MSLTWIYVFNVELPICWLKLCEYSLTILYSMTKIRQLHRDRAGSMFTCVVYYTNCYPHHVEIYRTWRLCCHLNANQISACRKFDTDRCNCHRQCIAINSSPVVADPGTFYRNKNCIIMSWARRCQRYYSLRSSVFYNLSSYVDSGHRVRDIYRKLPYTSIEPQLWWYMIRPVIDLYDQKHICKILSN